MSHGEKSMKNNVEIKTQNEKRYGYTILNTLEIVFRVRKKQCNINSRMNYM